MIGLTERIEYVRQHPSAGLVLVDWLLAHAEEIAEQERLERAVIEAWRTWDACDKTFADHIVKSRRLQDAQDALTAHLVATGGDSTT